MKLTQGEKSERSRALILEAALQLFSKQGYRGTSIREIAEAAGLSTGNVYHHFPDKETLFRTLLDQYWEAIDTPEFPFNKALAAGAFPDDLKAGRASGDKVGQAETVSFAGRALEGQGPKSFREEVNHMERLAVEPCFTGPMDNAVPKVPFQRPDRRCHRLLQCRDRVVGQGDILDLFQEDVVELADP